MNRILISILYAWIELNKIIEILVLTWGLVKIFFSFFVGKEPNKELINLFIQTITTEF